MEIVVTHPRFGKGLIDKFDFIKNKKVTVYFDDKKYRQVHSSLLKKNRDKYAFLND